MTYHRTSGAGNKFWKTQLPIDFIDTSLTINDWMEISPDLSEGKPAKLWFLILKQTNNGTSAEDIDLEVTINGTAYVFTGTLTNATNYYGVIDRNLDTGDFSPILDATANTCIGAYSNVHAIPFVAESVGLIRVQQTTNVDGTSAQIEVNIAWEKLVNVP